MIAAAGAARTGGDNAPAIGELEILADLMDGGGPAAVAIGEFAVLADLVDGGELAAGRRVSRRRSGWEYLGVRPTPRARCVPCRGPLRRL